MSDKDVKLVRTHREAYDVGPIGESEEPTRWEMHPTPFVLRDPKTIPPREWIYGRHYIRKFVSATVAPGGLGKTSLTAAEAVAMATGRPLLGIEVPRPLKVWVFNLEDPREELERRIAAICVHYGIRQDEIAGRLFVDSGRDQPLVIARAGRGETIITPVADMLTKAIKEQGIDVIIVDPFIQSHEVSENDNSGIAIVARAWAQIANDANCAVELSHHVRKSGAMEPSIEDARGAKALLDASRSARRLVRMTEKEAELAGIEPGQVWRYSREGDGKENLAPPDRARTWRKLESVELGNGDNVGVMTPWEWPDPFTDVHVDDLKAVRRKAAQKTYRADSRSPDWIGKVVAEVLDIDPADKTNKARISAILKTWIKNGEFEEYAAEDDHRKTRRYIRVIEKEDSAPVDDF